MMTTQRSKFKTLLGIVLVLLAVASLVFWEAGGREMFLMDEVLVAKETVKPGTRVEPDMFRAVSVPADALVEGAVSPRDAESMRGLVADGAIYKGAQLTARQLGDGKADSGPETSCFVIKNEWISMCTSSLRRGDAVDLLSRDGTENYGRFEVAYVKDSEGREVTDATSGMLAFTEEESERVNASSPIHHIEIRCEWSQYAQIKADCEAGPAAGLILIRREGSL